MLNGYILLNWLIAKLAFPARYTDQPYRFHELGERAGLDFKQQTELVDALAVLNAWSDRFANIFGPLVRLEHRSNGDDPPDVVAFFEDGGSLAIEHTIAEHSHLKHHRSIFPNGGCTLPASSQPTKNRDVLIEQTFSLYEPGRWARVDAEDAADRAMVRATIEKKLSPSKLAQFPNGGMLLLAIKSSARSNFRRAVELALVDSRKIRDWTTFIYVAIDRPTPGRYVSLLSSGTEFCEWREGKFSS